MPVKKAPKLGSDLQHRLESGEWLPGDLMPNERALATEYGVARNTVRKVLTQLAEDGLIERQVGRGTVVLDRPDGQFTGILDHFLDASPLDILNLRIFIEPHSAEAAARNASSVELEAIIEADAKCAETSDLERYEYWDSQFHKRIHQAAHNAFLTDLFDLLSIIRPWPGHRAGDSHARYFQPRIAAPDGRRLHGKNQSRNSGRPHPFPRRALFTINWPAGYKRGGRGGQRPGGGEPG